MFVIFLKSRGFKDFKYDMVVVDMDIVDRHGHGHGLAPKGSGVDSILSFFKLSYSTIGLFITATVFDCSF